MAEFITKVLAREVAEEVYLDAVKPYPDGWELDNSFGVDGKLLLSNGFFAYALKPSAYNSGVPSTTRVLAFRGTEMESFRDLYADASDIGWATFKASASTINGWLAQAMAAGQNVELVGHSLGGALVQWTINSDNLALISSQAAQIASNTGKPAPNVLGHLHFQTFNAPGITYSPGAGAGQPRGSSVEGTHYVLAYQKHVNGAYLIGDPIHMMGGPHVGGVLVGLNATAAGHFAHSIKNDTGLWTNSLPLTGYTPPFLIDARASQEFARAAEQLLGSGAQATNEKEAADKLILILSWAGARKVAPFNPFLAAGLAISGSMPTVVDKLLIPGTQGITEAMAYLRDQAVAKGANAMDYTIKLASSVYDTISHQLGQSAQDLATLIDQLTAFLVDTAKGVANSFSEFTAKFADATFNLGESLGVSAYRTFADAIDSALGGSTASVNGELVDAVKKAQDIVEAGGETIAILAGAGSNPFDNPQFDPHAVSMALNLKQYSAKTFTLYLPYGAGADGQKVHLKISGSAAASMRLVDGSQGLVPAGADGGFDVSIAPGERQVTLSLVVEGDIAQDDTLALSAALVDANGQPTHELYQQVTLQVGAGDDTPFQTGTAPSTVVTGVAGVTDTGEPVTRYTGDDTGNLVVTGDGFNAIHVGNGDNSIVGGTGTDRIYSGTGNSTIRGGGGEDFIFTDGHGDNLIIGNGGSDIIYTGWGHNRIYVGEEVDVETAIKNSLTATATGKRGSFITVTDGETTIVGGNGNDVITMGGSTNVVVAGPGNDTIYGGLHVGEIALDYSVELTEDATGRHLKFNNVGYVKSSGLYPDSADYQGNFDPDGTPLGVGDTTIFGGSGNHLIVLSNGKNYVDLGTGNSTVEGGNEADTIFGGSGKSVIRAAGGDDYIVAGDGAHSIDGGRGNNIIIGGSGKSVINVNDSRDGWADLNQGNNYVQAGSGDTLIRGSGGDDILLGGSGNDTIFAGNGNTTIDGGSGSDYIVGGSGNDVIYAGDGGTSQAPVTVVGGSGHTTVYGGAGVDVIKGGSGDNVLYAGDGGTADAATTVAAGAGNTTIYGGSGVDVLLGGSGNDVLYAGSGGTDGDAMHRTRVYAGDGNNTLVAGSGYATLFGSSSGHTTFVLNSDNGDTVVYGAKATDTIVFNDGTLPTDLSVGAQLYSNGDTALVLSSGNAKVTVMNGLLGTAGQFQFGSSFVTLPDLLRQAQSATQQFSDGTNELAFTAAAGATLTATAANSRLVAYGDHSTLVAGSGKTTMAGGGGNDTYVINSQQIEAAITNSAASDKLQFGGAITPAGIHATWTPGSGATSGVVTLAFEQGGFVTISGDPANMLSNVQFADGSTTTLGKLVLGSSGVPLPGFGYSKVTDDGRGNVVTTYYDNSGAKISDTWTKADGSSGADVFNADGSSTGTVKYANGTTATIANDGKGTLVTRNFDASGVLSGSSTRVTDSQGETITYFNASGQKLNDSWTRIDGSHGTDTYNSDGSGTGTSSGYPDGATASRTDDGHGNVTTIFTLNGVKVRDVWQKADGSTGTDKFNADGSSAGVIFYPDGRYSTYSNDGHGVLETITYDPQGNVLDDKVTAQGGVTRVDNADGSYRITVDGGNGNVTTTYYDNQGSKYHISWSKPDSSHGDEYYKADGSGSGASYRVDGSYSTYARTADGLTTTKNFDWSGKQTSTNYTRVNGLNVINTLRDPGGYKISETWTHSDGSTGTDVLDDKDWGGRRALIPYAQWYANFWKIGTSQSGASGGTYVNGSASVSARAQEDFTGSALWYVLYFAAAKQANYYGELGNSYMDDGLTKIDFQVDLLSDGTRKIWATRFDNSISIYNIVPAGQSYTVRVAGVNGTSAVFTDDGQGNISVTTYGADGAKVGDSWLHNDASYGVDIYKPDGSSFGFAADNAGKATQYTDNGHGNLSTSAVAPAPVAPTNAVPSVLTFQRSLGWGGSPVVPLGMGEWSNSQITPVPDGNGGTYYVSFNYLGGVTVLNTNKNGQYVADGMVDTDPGYGTSVMVNGKKVGWKYDVNGKPVNSFVDDLNGTVTRYTYDSTGKTAGYTVEVTDSQGKVTTSRYDASNHQIGSSIQTQGSDGVVTTLVFDETGRPTGSTVYKSDGKGNSVTYSFDAAGHLAGSRTTVVTNTNEVTITSYDAQGKPLGAYVTRHTDDGIIYTSNYDANGALVDSVVARPDGAGKFVTSNYDAQGNLTGYVTLGLTSGNKSTITMYNAGGIKDLETFVAADNTLVSTDYRVDGSTVATKRNADRSYSTTVTTPQGDATTTSYSAQGVKLGDTWSRQDGTSGTDTFNADGTATGTLTYRDKSYSRFTKDKQGKISATHYTYYGSVTGSSVTTTANGTVQTDNFDNYGRKISDEWSKADGTSGMDAYNSDGTRSATVNDGHGASTTSYYTAKGVKTREEWSKIDGSHGSSIYNADGSYESTVVDALGNEVTTSYDTHGIRVSDYWTKTDYSTGSDTYASDGSWTAIVNKAGKSTTTLYSPDGAALEDSWTNWDGTTGSDKFNSDGSVVSTVRKTDGSTTTTTVKADGSYSVFSGDAAGNGSTAQYNENGFMLSRHWQKADGTSGDESFKEPAATPHVAHALANRTAGVNYPFAFTIPENTFVETVAGDTLRYTISVVGGGALPAWLAFDPVTRKLSGTPPSGDQHPVLLKVTATEQGGLKVSATFVLSVSSVAGGAPVLNDPIDDVSTDELKPFSFVIPADTFSDSNAAATLVYSATLVGGAPLPAWLQFDSETGTFTGTPPDESVGTPLQVEVTATDSISGLTAATVFEMKVNALDTLLSGVSIVLPAHVHNLTGTGSADLVLTGNALANIITANSGNDTLVAGSGLATLVGGAGNDTFVVNNAADVIVESAGNGINTVLTSVDFVLPAHVQNLTGTGTGNLRLTGNDLANVITANGGNDTLVAGSGLATLVGGAGNDVFVVNNDKDVIVEQPGQGYNKVQTSVSFVLPENVQEIEATGTASVTLGGNGKASIMRANSGNDTLVAGAGIATMYGGAGNDTFVVNHAADVIVEQAGGGINTVLSSVDYVLPAHVQNLTGTGSADITLTGNDLANVITANGGNDTLVAGAGVATLIGGSGNTTFVINNALDVVQAKAGGTNTVESSVSYTASANVRNVTGTGTADLVLAGNELDNVITANDGNDTLVAGAGNDTLVSGAGNDNLVGGAGNTTFVYGLGDGMDTIKAGTGTSTVRFGDGIKLDNAVIRLTYSDGTPCEIVQDGASGHIHGTNPNGSTRTLTAHLVVLDEHGVVQPGQGMVFTVTMDATGNISSPVSNFRFADGVSASFPDMVVKAETLRGDDTKGVIATGHNDDVVYAGPNTTEINVGSGNSTVYGGPRGTLVHGGGGVTHFMGGQGDDIFVGGRGVSVVQGVQGRASFTAADGPAVLQGGRGGDVLVGGSGNAFLAGGAGNDEITSGSAPSVVAFNKDEGDDRLHLGAGPATLSLGGGISEGDLTFTRHGDDLVLGTGGHGTITLSGWYTTTPDKHNLVTLQLVEAASKSYNPKSTDPLVNRKVETFDFGKLAGQFDAAVAANPKLTSWSLMDGLLSAHLAGSDGEAIGGDLAFYYGLNGGLAGIGLDVAVATVQDSRFGKSAQKIDSWSEASHGGHALR